MFKVYFPTYKVKLLSLLKKWKATDLTGNNNPNVEKDHLVLGIKMIMCTCAVPGKPAPLIPVIGLAGPSVIPNYLSIYIFLNQSTYLSINLCIYLSIYLLIKLSHNIYLCCSRKACTSDTSHRSGRTICHT